MPSHPAAPAASVADPAAQPAAVAATVAALNELALALRAAGEVEAARSTWSAALRLAPQHAILHANLGALLQDLGEREPALEHYRQARTASPQWAEVWNNSGILLRQLGRPEQARAAFERALQLAPGDVAARYNLGNVLLDAGAKAQALAHFRAVVEQAPEHAEAHYGLACCLSDPLAAIDEYEAALRARPDFPEALVGLACARLRVCDWRDLQPAQARIEALVRERPEAAVSPFSFLQLSGDARLQRDCARAWSAHRVRRLSAPAPRAHRRAGDRLRVGYLSGDFRDHAVGNLVCDLFRAHDRSAFEIVAYSSGPDDGSAVRRRVQEGAERFVDVSALDDPALARLLHGDELDILVDLSGYTEFSRSAVLSARPAAVQMSYLGYPGSMGSPFVDYLVADAFLVPAPMRACYDERVIELPLCYQPSPDSRPTVFEAAAARRSALGLPEDAFVFACFNNPYKIRPELFAAWMLILRECTDSVLWLGAFNAASCANLRARAREQGVDPGRLVFAPMVPFDAHSARLPAADLFLDTHPYSAGATANQTLACGVPLLTMVGDCYVSRMAGSVLHALELDELITSTPDQYVGRALALAGDAAAMDALRARVKAGRERLFCPATGARALEQAFRAVWAQRAGAARTPGA